MRWRQVRAGWIKEARETGAEYLSLKLADPTRPARSTQPRCRVMAMTTTSRLPGSFSPTIAVPRASDHAYVSIGSWHGSPVDLGGRRALAEGLNFAIAP